MRVVSRVLELKVKVISGLHRDASAQAVSVWVSRETITYTDETIEEVLRA